MGRRRPGYQKLSEKELARQQAIRVMKAKRLMKEAIDSEKNKETENKDTM